MILTKRSASFYRPLHEPSERYLPDSVDHLLSSFLSLTLGSIGGGDGDTMARHIEDDDFAECKRDGSLRHEYTEGRIGGKECMIDCGSRGQAISKEKNIVHAASLTLTTKV